MLIYIEAKAGESFQCLTLLVCVTSTTLLTRRDRGARGMGEDERVSKSIPNGGMAAR